MKCVPNKKDKKQNKTTKYEKGNFKYAMFKHDKCWINGSEKKGSTKKRRHSNDFVT